MKAHISPIFLIIALFLILVGEAAAHPPWAIVVDDKNQIYLSDLETIWKVDANGKASVFRAGVNGRHTHEIRIDADGNLLGEDLTYEPSTQKYITSLWKITPNGNFSFTLAPTAAPPKAVSIWKNRAGASYYFGQTDDEKREPYLLKRSRSGTIATLIGDAKNALRERQVLLYSLAGITFAPNETLYATDRTSIWKIAPDDKVSVVVNRNQILDKFPNANFLGITVDTQNNILAADLRNRKILKITSGGAISVFAESETNWSPTGVFFRNGSLYVLEAKNELSGANIVVRVRKIAADGKASTVVTINESQTNAPVNSNQNNFSSPISGQPINKSCAALAMLIVACMVFRKEIAAKIGNAR
jgi:sugar lactone lactonase YvrE